MFIVAENTGSVNIAKRMNTLSGLNIGLDILNCHAKFRGDTISRSQENDVTSVLGYGRPDVTL